MSEQHDPVVSAYLAFLEKDMADNPSQLSPFTDPELEKLSELTTPPAAPQETKDGR